MSRDEQFFSLLLLIGNIWLATAWITDTDIGKIICASCGAMFILTGIALR